MFIILSSHKRIFLQKIGGRKAGTWGNRETPRILGVESQFENLQFTVSVKDAVCVNVPLFVEAVLITPDYCRVILIPIEWERPPVFACMVIPAWPVTAMLRLPLVLELNVLASPEY